MFDTKFTVKYFTFGSYDLSSFTNWWDSVSQKYIVYLFTGVRMHQGENPLNQYKVTYVQEIWKTRHHHGKYVTHKESKCYWQSICRSYLTTWRKYKTTPYHTSQAFERFMHIHGVATDHKTLGLRVDAIYRAVASRSRTILSRTTIIILLTTGIIQLYHTIFLNLSC